MESIGVQMILAVIALFWLAMPFIMWREQMYAACFGWFLLNVWGGVVLYYCWQPVYDLALALAVV